MRNVTILHVFAHGFCDNRRIVQPGFRQHCDKFFTAVTRDKIAPPFKRVFKHVGNVFQTFVAGRMSVIIIKRFKHIHIDKNDRELSA